MSKINLEKLYHEQASLDALIASNHQINYETTFTRRLLAFMVELGELANETRCFKYWSNKGPSSKDIILDEFADALHFLLSLGIPLKANKYHYQMHGKKIPLDVQFINLYRLGADLLDNYNLDNYYLVMQELLNLGAMLGFNEREIIDAYLKKLAINYSRQKNNY